MKATIAEKTLLNQAVEALKRTVPFNAKIDVEFTPTLFGNDAILAFIINKNRFQYLAEIKATATKTVIAQILIQKRRVPNLLLVTRFVNPNLADDLIRDDIEFLDTAGNVFMHSRDLLIMVKGNKPPKAPWDIAPNRPFLPKGLKVVFALLCKKNLIDRPYREIAVAADVALGTVALVMKDLQMLGFLIKRKKRNFLVNKAQLLERWVGEFNERLRRKQWIGRFQAQYDWWKNAKLPANRAWWGGEVAAARLTRYLRPEFATLYTTRENVHELAIKNRWKKDDAGNVELIEKFWGPEIDGIEEDLVHPILIYADLLAKGDKRNIETAKMIYETEIAGLVRED